MSDERHVYLEPEEFEAFLRGAPVERETSGIALKIFPPREADHRQLLARIAATRDRDDPRLILANEDPERGRRRADMSLRLAHAFTKARRANTFMIFDEAGALDRDLVPDDVSVVQTAEELVDELDDEEGSA